MSPWQLPADEPARRRRFSRSRFDASRTPWRRSWGGKATTAQTVVVTSHSVSRGELDATDGNDRSLRCLKQGPPQSLAIALEGNWALKTSAGTTRTKTATAFTDADPGNTHILALRPAP